MAKNRHNLERLLRSAFDFQRRQMGPGKMLLEPEKVTVAKFSRILGGGLIALFFALIIAALTFRGVISTDLAHACMFAAWVVGSLLICTEIIPGKPPHHKAVSVLGLGAIMLAADLTMALLKKDEPLHSQVDITIMELHPATAPPYVLVGYRNGGVISTKQEIVMASTFCREEVPEQKVIDDLFAEFLKRFNEMPRAKINWRSALDPGESFKDQYYGDELNHINISELLASHQWVYFIGGILYSDTTGHYRRVVCRVWFSPNIERSGEPSKIMENWRSCVPSGAKAWEAAASDDKY